MELGSDLLLQHNHTVIWRQLGWNIATMVAGIAVLGWFFVSDGPRFLFDFTHIYTLGAGVGLSLYGLIRVAKNILLLRDPVRLQAVPYKKNQRIQAESDRAMALGYKLFMLLVIVGLIPIGEIFSETAFVVCLFLGVGAYFCYFFAWLWLRFHP